MMIPLLQNVFHSHFKVIREMGIMKLLFCYAQYTAFVVLIAHLWFDVI